MAGVAQSVEQLTRNEKVGGSIPLSGTNKMKELVCFFAFLISRESLLRHDPKYMY